MARLGIALLSLRKSERPCSLFSDRLFSAPPICYLTGWHFRQGQVTRVHRGYLMDKISVAQARKAESDLIFDFSASIPVARHLARDVDANGRRMSSIASGK